MLVLFEMGSQRHLLAATPDSHGSYQDAPTWARMSSSLRSLTRTSASTEGPRYLCDDDANARRQRTSG